jgi:hypothetical protein
MAVAQVVWVELSTPLKTRRNDLEKEEYLPGKFFGRETS